MLRLRLRLRLLREVIDVVEVQLKAMLSWHADELTKEGKHSFMSHSASLFLSMKTNDATLS